jgi:hypothetical protein
MSLEKKITGHDRRMKEKDACQERAMSHLAVVCRGWLGENSE